MNEPRTPIISRRPKLALDGRIPRRWFGGEALPTHVFNGLNLMFPHGEAYLVRSVRALADRVDDPALARDVRGFYAQEHRHATEHGRFVGVLEAQGFDLRLWQRYESALLPFFEKRLSPSLNLAATAAFEHYTATIAARVLAASDLDRAHPEMRELFRWHGVEEVEHKSVAFDVLAATCPGYPVRMAGLLLGTGILVLFWPVASTALLLQDPAPPGELLAQLLRLRRTVGFGLRDLAGAFVRYAAPGFHPWGRAPGVLPLAPASGERVARRAG